MRNSLRLYGRYIALSLRGQMQYRLSFIMLSLGTLLGAGMEFLGVWSLFDRFEHLRDWRLAEVALFYGMVNLAMALTKTASYGFDRFEQWIRSGDFDRLLLRPRSTALQLLGQRLQAMRIGQFAQGLTVLLWAISALDIAWSVPKVMLLVLAIVSGACVFYSLFILRATLCFWTTQGMELVNALSYGGVETARYPLSIYRPWFRHFFTFVVPLACISYYPALAILGRADPLGSSIYFQWLAPAIGFIFLFLSVQVWRFGVRHYCSTGS